METLLEVKNLSKHFKLKSETFSGTRPILKAVDNISFSVNEGEILGIVGESGCGKSTLGKTILRLYEKTSGSVFYRNKDIFSLGKSDLKKTRKKMQMIFQDPYSSLNPRKKISELIKQPLRIHGIGDRISRQKIVEDLLSEVGISPIYKNRFPHQFSGGQRQRIGIARALALGPEFLICDEAVSALDVSVQAQIINLLMDLQEKHGFTYIFIAHDLGVVEFIANRIIVMYLGKIVEIAEKSELTKKHLHPYTKALFAAFPASSPKGREKKEKIVMGDVPSPINPPRGCHFSPRCPVAKDICRKEYPELKEVAPGHMTACWLYNS